MITLCKKIINRIYKLLTPAPKQCFAVERWYQNHPGGSSCCCAKQLNMQIFLVNRALSFLKKRNFSMQHYDNDGKFHKKYRIFFKTLFYAPHELPFIIMNLKESYNYIDKFIIVEGNRTQAGEEKPFILHKYLADFPSELADKILYIPADLSDDIVDCSESNNGIQMHKNENFLWDCFERYISINDNDIIISTDADEVIFRSSYPLILQYLNHHDVILLPLHQFFYKMNYLWENLTVWAPQATRARHYLHKPYPHRWRYEGREFPLIAGCHFSWQLTIEQMLYKLRTYAHKDIYGHLAKPEILEAAVRDKTYPFEPTRPFHIEELDPEKDRIYYPQSFYEMKDSFTHLL